MATKKLAPIFVDAMFSVKVNVLKDGVTRTVQISGTKKTDPEKMVSDIAEFVNDVLGRQIQVTYNTAGLPDTKPMAARPEETNVRARGRGCRAHV